MVCVKVLENSSAVLTKEVGRGWLAEALFTDNATMLMFDVCACAPLMWITLMVISDAVLEKIAKEKGKECEDASLL